MLPSPSISRSWELFKNAHLVVKLVMIGLLAASVWSWAIILEKLFLFAKTRKETDKFEQVFWSGQSLDELYQALSQRRNTGMAALFVAAMREWKRCIERKAETAHAWHAAQGREGDGRDHQPRGGAARAAADFPRDRRLDRAVRRIVRHGVGHHDELPGHRRQQEHKPRGGRARLSPRLCSPPRSACSPPFLRSFSITNSTAKSRATARVWKASPMSSPPSCRGRSTRRREERRWALAANRLSSNRRRRRRSAASDERDQRDADGRRHARAAHHLHGDGAAAHGRRARSSCRRSICRRRKRRGRSPTRSRSASPSIRKGRSSSRTPRSDSTKLCPKLTAIAKAGVEAGIFVRGDKAPVITETSPEVLARIGQAGFPVTIVTDLDGSERPKARCT